MKFLRPRRFVTTDFEAGARQERATQQEKAAREISTIIKNLRELVENSRDVSIIDCGLDRSKPRLKVPRSYRPEYLDVAKYNDGVFIQTTTDGRWSTLVHRLHLPLDEKNSVYHLSHTNEDCQFVGKNIHAIGPEGISQVPKIGYYLGQVAAKIKFQYPNR